MTSTQLADERYEAELKQALLLSRHVEQARQNQERRTSFNDSQSRNESQNGAQSLDVNGGQKNAGPYSAIKALTQNTDLRLGNEFDHINDPLGDTLIYIGVPAPSPDQTRDEYPYITKHFDKFIVVQSAAIRALQSNVFDKLLGPTPCFRAEKRFNKLSAFKKVDASIKSRIKFHIDLRPPNEDDDAVLLVTDLTCSYGILNWHRSEDMLGLSTGAVAGTDHFDGPSNPYYVEVKNATDQVLEPEETPPAAEYCPVRHHSGLERLINAIVGNDPKLDSAPKMWVFFALAKYFDCSHNDVVRKWILAWLWQPHNHNFVQCNPEAAYRIGLGCQTPELARDAFAILVGEKALVDISHQLHGTVSASLSSVHGRPFEILDDDEKNRIGHASTSLVQRIRTTLQSLFCETEWMSESLEFQKFMNVSFTLVEQRQVLGVAQKAVVDYVKYRLSSILFKELKRVHEILLSNKAGFKLPHAKYTLDLVARYNELPFLARPFTRSFWQTVYNLDLADSEDMCMVAGSLGMRDYRLEEHDFLPDLSLVLSDPKLLIEVGRKISMVNDIIRAQNRSSKPYPVLRPGGVAPTEPQNMAPEPARQRFVMKRTQNQWYVDGQRQASGFPSVSLRNREEEPHQSEEVQEDLTTAMPTSPGKRRKLSGNDLKDGWGTRPRSATTGHDDTITQTVQDPGQGKQPTTANRSFADGWKSTLSFLPKRWAILDPPATSEDTNELLEKPGFEPYPSTVPDSGQLSSDTSPAGNSIQQWPADFMPAPQQPQSVPFGWQPSQSYHATGPQDGMQSTSPFFGRMEHSSYDITDPRAAPALQMDSNNDNAVGAREQDFDQADGWGFFNSPTPARRAVQQFSNNNTPSSGHPQVQRSQIAFDEETKNIITLDTMMSQLGHILHQRALEIVYPAHIFHDSSSLPVNLIDHIFCLTEDEWKYLPLNVGGFDDGSGGVFDDAVPNIEVGGFRGGKRGIGKDPTSNLESESESSSTFDDIASEAVSTVGKASKNATDGTETVKSYNTSESDTGFDYTDLFNEVQQLKVEQAEQAGHVTRGANDAGRREDDGDGSTIMGATSDVQGQFFGDDDDDELPEAEDFADEDIETSKSAVKNSYAARVADESDEDDIEFIDVPRL